MIGADAGGDSSAFSASFNTEVAENFAEVTEVSSSRLSAPSANRLCVLCVESGRSYARSAEAFFWGPGCPRQPPGPLQARSLRSVGAPAADAAARRTGAARRPPVALARQRNAESGRSGTMPPSNRTLAGLCRPELDDLGGHGRREPTSTPKTGLRSWRGRWPTPCLHLKSSSGRHTSRSVRFGGGIVADAPPGPPRTRERAGARVRVRERVRGGVRARERSVWFAECPAAGPGVPEGAAQRRSGAHRADRGERRARRGPGRCGAPRPPETRR